MTVSYPNPWYDPRNRSSPKVFTTEAKPTEYKGFLIYERIKGACWDVVKDGVCLTERAGLSGAKSYIDEQP